MARPTIALVALALGVAAPARAGDTTYSVDYVVTVRRADPGTARIRWLLSGIDEIESLRLVFRDERASGVHGTGSLTWEGRTLHWRPGGPYAHLAYTVAVDRARPPGGSRYDSYAGPDWIATRALHLFPVINVSFRPGAERARSRARLVFRLPSGWHSDAPFERLARHTFRLFEPGKHFDRPRGWFLLGASTRFTRTIAGTRLTVARAPGSTLDARRLLRLYAATVPLLATILGPPPPRLLLVSAPDPLWRGGLSGEDSYFVHGHLPIRSADRTSTYLHELFHVWAPFRSAPDGHWISEGLAEYYSLALPHRARRLSDRGFARGLALFARDGRWGGDLSRTRDPAALNNSAPLVMHRIDLALREATGGARSLDDAVREVVRDRRPLSTAAFLRAVNRVGGRNFTPLFRRHVYRGFVPTLPAGS